MHSLLVYVAGPYRAPTISGVRANIERARAVAEQLWAAGYPTVCPHLNTALMDGIASDVVFLAGAKLMLERCDRMVLVQRWNKSAGTRAEVGYAISRGLAIYRTAAGCVANKESAYAYLQSVMSEAFE